MYYILYGSFDILLKKYFLVFFNSIYFVLLLMGAFVWVPLLIYDIIAFFVNKNISGIIIIFIDNINTIKNVFLFIVDLIFIYISVLGIFWTIYYFTPFHLITSEFISELINYYIRLSQFKKDGNDKFGFFYDKHNIVIFSVFFFVNLICSLIFNEIIILKFCNLEYYTKKYIKQRAELDVEALLMRQDSIISETELITINDNK